MRPSGVDLVLAPWEFEALFRTAAKIDDFQQAVEFAYALYVPSRLSPRLSCAIHTNDGFLTRNSRGEIVGYHVPSSIGDCRCNRCRELARNRARDADDPDADWTDFIDEYWQPKSHAGGRHIPVLQERGKEILNLYEMYCMRQPNMTGQTYRNRLTRLEELCEEVDLKISAQGCRATCANYWAIWGLQPKELRWLMGWKYISTAQYYMRKSDVSLRWKMQLALGRQPTIPYEIYREPPTFLEIRSALNPDEMLRDITLTPESQQTVPSNPDDETLLEKLAQEDLEDGDLNEFGAAFDPISRPLQKRVEHEIAEVENSPKPHVGFDKRRTAVSGVIGFSGSVAMGIVSATDGLYADVMAGRPEGIIPLLIVAMVMIPYMIWSMNELVYEEPQELEADTFVDKILLTIHAAVDSVAKRT